MQSQIILFALFAALALSGPCAAQSSGVQDGAPRMEIPWPPWWADLPPPGPPTVPVPAPDVPGPQVIVRRTTALLDMLASWLGANFDIPASAERPRVELVPRVRLAALRYRGLVSDRTGSLPSDAAAGPLGDLHAVHAVYDDERRTIYLPEDWEGETPADISVLVHEMVHHLQNVAGLKFGCPQEREALAYAAQSRWLEMFGKTIDNELGIDAFDIAVRTRCFN